MFLKPFEHFNLNLKILVDFFGFQCFKSDFEISVENPGVLVAYGFLYALGRYLIISEILKKTMKLPNFMGSPRQH